MKFTSARPEDWAKTAGYELVPIEYKRENNIILGHSEFPVYQKALKIAATEIDLQPCLIRAKDMQLLIVNGEAQSHNYKYILISRENQILVDGQIHQNIWLPMLGGFDVAGDDDIYFDQRLIEKKVLLNDTAKTIFVGGQTHFGHWLVDHLATVIFCERYLSPYISGYKYSGPALNNFQVDTLRQARIGHPFEQHSIGSTRYTLLTVKELFLVCNLSIFLKYELLKQSLTSSDLGIGITSADEISSRRRIYLERGVIRSARRLANELELIQLLKKYDFDVIKPHELTTAEKKHVLSKYDLFLSPPGAPYFNFNVFAKKNASLVYLCHETVLGDTESGVFGHALYQVPDLYRTSIVKTTQVGGQPGGAPNVDLPCVADLAEIEHRIRQLIG